MREAWRRPWRPSTTTIVWWIFSIFGQLMQLHFSKSSQPFEKRVVSCTKKNHSLAISGCLLRVRSTTRSSEKWWGARSYLGSARTVTKLEFPTHFGVGGMFHVKVRAILLCTEALVEKFA